MDEPTAWLRQAMADRRAAEGFAQGPDDGEGRCHAVAQWQQAVEKAVKALVASLRDAGVLHIEIGFRHEVERFIRVLIRLPRARDNRAIQQHLHGLLDQATRAGIKALDALVPKRPPPGADPQRNTEYPFIDADGNWNYPAAKDVFSQAKIDRFRALAHRVLHGAGRIVSAIRRGPKPIPPDE